jgi:hypothetical protein
MDIIDKIDRQPKCKVSEIYASTIAAHTTTKIVDVVIFAFVQYFSA